MKVRVLGCSGAIAKDCRTTSFLIDGDTTSIGHTGPLISSHPSQRLFYRSDRGHPSRSRPAATASSANTNRSPDQGG